MQTKGEGVKKPKNLGTSYLEASLSRSLAGSHPRYIIGDFQSGYREGRRGHKRLHATETVDRNCLITRMNFRMAFSVGDKRYCFFFKVFYAFPVGSHFQLSAAQRRRL